VSVSWPTIKLADACTVFTDGNWIETKDQSPKGIRLIQTGNVGAGDFKDRQHKARYISDETFERLKCEEVFERDCLVSRLPDPVGRSCIIPSSNERMITAVDCSILRFKQNVLLPEFFNYYSQSSGYLADIEAYCTGATRKRISRKNLGNVAIPAPTVDEQKRIVTILDETFAGIDAAIANTEKNLANARELFESYLESLFSNHDEGWQVKPLESIATIINGYAFKSGDFSPENEVKSIKITNVGVYEFFHDDTNYLPKGFREKYTNYMAREGDLVIALTRTIISSGLKVAVVPANYDQALVNQRVAAVHVDEKVIPRQVLHAFLSTKKAINYVRSNVNELMQPNLSIKDLKAFPIPVPPTNIKSEITSQISEIRDQANRLKSIYISKLTALNELNQSLLQKAFSGELTADPDTLNEESVA